VLQPTRATTKISLAATRRPLAVPAGWWFLRGGGEGRSGIHHRCQLCNIQSALGRKHQSTYNEHFTTNKNMLQEGKINGPQEKKIKTIIELLITIVETK